MERRQNSIVPLSSVDIHRKDDADFLSKDDIDDAHEIFHLFVMGGSLCHYVMMYRFVA